MAVTKDETKQLPADFDAQLLKLLGFLQRTDRPVYVGVDLGFEGALTVIDEYGGWCAIDLPYSHRSIARKIRTAKTHVRRKKTIEAGTIRKEVQNLKSYRYDRIDAVLDTFRTAAVAYPSALIEASVEGLSKGGKSVKLLARLEGYLLGSMRARGFPRPERIRPYAWKTVLGLTIPKAVSTGLKPAEKYAMAKRLTLELFDQVFKPPKDHPDREHDGRFEAALLASVIAAQRGSLFWKKRLAARNLTDFRKIEFQPAEGDEDVGE